jgi:hypothetical protein
VQVTCHKSALSHSGAVEERIQTFLKKNVFQGEKKNAIDPNQIFVRLVNDEVQACFSIKLRFFKFLLFRFPFLLLENFCIKELKASMSAMRHCARLLLLEF